MFTLQVVLIAYIAKQKEIQTLKFFKSAVLILNLDKNDIEIMSEKEKN